MCSKIASRLFTSAAYAETLRLVNEEKATDAALDSSIVRLIVWCLQVKDTIVQAVLHPPSNPLIKE